MKRRSTPSLPRPRRAAALLLGLLLAFTGAAGAAPPEDAAVLARVDGAPLTAGAVRGIQLVTGGGPEGARAALDLAIDGQLFYAEALRRGLAEQPDVAGAVAGDSAVLLVEQYVLATRGAELKKAREPGIHSSREMQGTHGGIMSEAAQLKDLVEKLEKEAAGRAGITFLSEAYQKPNESGVPRGQLVVGRVGDEPILWSEVEEVARAIRDLEPPLTGIPAYTFVSGIRRVAGKKQLRREAEAALPSFRAAYDRARERLVKALVTRRLLALEADTPVTLGDAELQAYFDANKGKYATIEGPATLDQVRDKVARDAERDAKAAQRAALAKRLRAGATIEVDQKLLESLGE